MRILVNSFNVGEVSAELAGRLDLEALRKACRIQRNFIPRSLGGARRRPGMMHLGYAKYADRRCRLLPFNFSATSRFVLELGHLYIRFWKDGALVGSPLELPTPYTEGQLGSVQMVQVNDLVFLTHPAHPPQQLRRLTDTSWTFGPLEWNWPAMRDMNITGLTIAADATTGSVNLTASAPLWSTGHVGGYFALSHMRETASVELVSENTVKASATLALQNQPTAGDRVSIGNVVYTFVSGAPVAAYQVELGTALTDTRDNLIAAINGTGGGPGTAAHPLVTGEEQAAAPSGVKASATLNCNNNDIAGKLIHIGATTYRIADTLSVPYDVKRGADIAASLTNLYKAITATGTAGTEYSTGTLAHTQVTAAAPIGGNLVVTALSAGAAGNSIGTTLSNTSRLSWSSPTLVGGTDASTERIKVTARAFGLAGNGIPLAETSSNLAWNTNSTGGGTAAADGKWDGSEERISGELSVLGKCNLFTYGSWAATLYLERWNVATAAWELVNSWTGKNDRNLIVPIEQQNRERLRLRVSTGSHTGATPVRFLLEAEDARIHGLVKITSFTDSQHVAADVVYPLLSTAPTADWSEGAWSNFRGFPRACALHQTRLLLAGGDSEPEKIRGSALDDFNNFQETDLDTSAFSIQIAAQEANPIVWMASASDGLIVGTEGDEWLLDSGDSVISPSNPPQVNRKTRYGSADVQAQMVGSTLLFIQRGGRRAREYVYAFDEQRYRAPDLTELSDHLTRGRIAEVAYAQNPDSTIFARTFTGELLTCTFKRESEVVAWTPHDTAGSIESVTVTTSPGDSDEVYFVVARSINGQTTRRIERFDPDHWGKLESSTVATLCHLDAASLFTTPGNSVSVPHLDGEEVSLWADGAILPSRRVVGGLLSLPETVQTLIVGLPYRSRLQPYLFDIPLQSGPSVGRAWRTAEIRLQLWNTGAGLMYADAPDCTFYAVPMLPTSAPTDAAPPLFTGLTEPLAMQSQHRTSLDITLETESPAPLNILAIHTQTAIYGD